MQNALFITWYPPTKLPKQNFIYSRSRGAFEWAMTFYKIYFFAIVRDRIVSLLVVLPTHRFQHDAQISYVRLCVRIVTYMSAWKTVLLYRLMIPYRYVNEVLTALPQGNKSINQMCYGLKQGDPVYFGGW